MCGAVTAIVYVHRLADGGTASMSSDIEVSCDISGSKLCLRISSCRPTAAGLSHYRLHQK